MDMLGYIIMKLCTQGGIEGTKNLVDISAIMYHTIGFEFAWFNKLQPKYTQVISSDAHDIDTFSVVGVTQSH